MDKFTSNAQQRRFEMLKNEFQSDEEFCLTAPEGEDNGEDSLGELSTFDGSEDSYDGQPDEYTEWQDVYGGDDWDHGQYDHAEYEWDCDLHNEF